MSSEKTGMYEDLSVLDMGYGKPSKRAPKVLCNQNSASFVLSTSGPTLRFQLTLKKTKALLGKYYCILHESKELIREKLL